MNEFGRRTDEELAELLYGSRKPESKLPPAGTPEPVAEEEPEAAAEGDPEVEELEENPGEGADDEGEWRENADGSALRFVRKTGATDLIDQDGPLMEFLEKDIDRLEAAQIEEEKKVEKNLKNLSEE